MSLFREPGELYLTALLAHLRAEEGVRALLCEGGPRLHAELIANGLVDELFVTHAPKLAGGVGPGFVSGLAEEERRLELGWLLAEPTPASSSAATWCPDSPRPRAPGHGRRKRASSTRVRAVVAPAGGGQLAPVDAHRAGPEPIAKRRQRGLDPIAAGAVPGDLERPSAGGLTRAQLLALAEARDPLAAREGEQPHPVAGVAQRVQAADAVAVAGERVDAGRQQRQHRARAREQR